MKLYLKYIDLIFMSLTIIPMLIFDMISTKIYHYLYTICIPNSLKSGITLIYMRNIGQPHMREDTSSQER